MLLLPKAQKSDPVVAHWRHFDRATRLAESRWQSVVASELTYQRGQIIGIADRTLEERETRKFQKQMIPASGKEFSREVRQWIDNNGTPRLRVITYPLLIGTGTKAVQQASAQLGVSFGVLQPGIRRYAAREADFLARVMGQTTGRMVAEAVQQGLDDGLSVREIRQRLVDHHAFSSSRAQLVARTETVRAWNGAQRESLSEYQADSGRVVTKIWLTAQDSRVRDAHQEMEGEQRGIDEEFSNGLQAPGEPNCRCTLLYQTSDPLPTTPLIPEEEEPDRFIDSPGTEEGPRSVGAAGRRGILFDKDGNAILKDEEDLEALQDLWQHQGLQVTQREFAERMLSVPEGWKVQITALRSMADSVDDLALEANLWVGKQHVGIINRYFDFRGRGSVLHDLFSLEEDFQGKGVARKVLASQVKLYDEIGIEKIKVNAGLDVGGHTWARFGFTPDKGQWPGVKAQIRATLKFRRRNFRVDEREARAIEALIDDPNSTPEDIWFIAANPLGKELLLGTEWSGSLRLSDPVARAIFDSYVKK